MNTELNTKLNTPTPRTDAAQFWDRSDYHDPSAFDWFVRAEHARTLERELSREREKVRVLRNAMKYLLNDDNYIDPQFDPCALASKAFEVTRDAK
jgi:hypothetical protein